MGFFDFLRRRKNVMAQPTLAADAPKETLTIDAPRTRAHTAMDATDGPATTGTAGTTATDVPAGRQCQALTAAGAQCQSAARGTSKYCGRHKGYRAPAALPTGADTKPARADVADTKPAQRRTAATATKATANGKAKTTARTTAKTATKGANGASGRGHVEHGGYRLYQKGNRYFFSKKSAKDVDGEPVREMPTGRTVVTTPNGMPVLKKK